MEWWTYAKGRMANKPKRPVDVPATPASVYREDWQGWGDWLGNGNVAPENREWRSFASARAFVRKLGLKSAKEWRALCRDELAEKGPLPTDIPRSPWLVYADEWTSVGDWLGTGAVWKKEFRPFKEARAFARSLGLKTTMEWQALKVDRPGDIPAAPERIYRDEGWRDYADWLGLEPYDSARRSEAAKRGRRR